MPDETTELPAGQERAFDQWLQRNHVKDLDHPDSHYDYRGAFLAGIGRGNGTGHFPDTFKQHGHPTFSIESRYSKGQDDGGSWDGETFIPGHPMTDAGPRFLPGQPIGYGMTPGVHHDVTDDRYDLDAPKAPYGMTPGQRHVIPDQIDLDAPPQPDQVQLDESPHPLTPPPGNEHKGSPVGWRVKDSAGNVVAELHNVNTRDYQAKQVEAVGQSLIDQAITPEDKEAAQRATAFGKAMVGIAPSSEITKRMVAQYDTDIRNGISRSIQEEKSKRAAMRGSGGPGPAGPTKADKFQAGLDKELRGTVDGVIESERKDSKHAALAQLDNDVSEMESLLSAPNAMAQRVAVQKALLALTGKASRESEQAALTGASGKWEELKNKLSLWTSDDPQLGAKYIQEFKQMLRTQRQYVNSQRQLIGKAAAARARAEAFGYPEEQRQLAADIAYGAMTGQYQGSAASPAPKPPAASAPSSPGVDPDLLK